MLRGLEDRIRRRRLRVRRRARHRLRVLRRLLDRLRLRLTTLLAIFAVIALINIIVDFALGDDGENFGTGCPPPSSAERACAFVDDECGEMYAVLPDEEDDEVYDLQELLQEMGAEAEMGSEADEGQETDEEGW